MPGATDTTRTTTPRVSPWIMSTSEGRASKKAKTVDYASLDGDSSDGVGRIICI